MVSLAGTSWSFDKASAQLKEMCHLTVSDDTIERVCQEEGERSVAWLEQSQTPVRTFARAQGEVEFSSDGLKINTVDGWREMRVSTFIKRTPTSACAPQAWDDRVLNEPQVRLMSCRLADSVTVSQVIGLGAATANAFPGGVSDSAGLCASAPNAGRRRSNCHGFAPGRY